MHCNRKYTREPGHPTYQNGIHRQTIEVPVNDGLSALITPAMQLAPPNMEVAKSLPNVVIPLSQDETQEALKPTRVHSEVPLDVNVPVTLPDDGVRASVLKDVKPVSISTRWGWLPEIALLQSGSLLLIAFSFVWARAGSMWSEAFFWLGLALLIVPVAIRMYSTTTPRHERIALILLLWAAFYLVKVMHSPYAFTFPDEFSNFRNVHEILQNQHLFEVNPELPVTALYPGLATITSMLSSLSGLSTFPAGLLVLAAARLVLFLGLFLLYEQVSGSARIAGLATLFYMGNANFLFYTAEFSYESLALPTAILVLYVVARRGITKNHWFALTAIAIMGMFTVVISHHMTSYILAALLLAATGISILRSRGKDRGPWDLALIMGVATAFWLVYVATYTLNYLSPVLGKAMRSIFRLAQQEETTRTLFKSSSTGYVSPLWEQLTVFGSVLLVVLGLPIGWWHLWRRYRAPIFFLLLGAVALVYLPMQGLRLTSAGWETANRSSEFLFIGVAFILALAIEQLWQVAWLRLRFGWATSLIIMVLFFGGFIAGWPPQARMPRPYLVSTGSHLAEPQAIAAAKWTLDFLGPDHRIATSKVGAKLISAYGEQSPFTGKPYGIKDMLFSSVVGPSEKDIIRGAGIEYIASERRLISWDHMIGLFFFNVKSSPSYELVESETFEKFDGLEGVNRIMDSGDIVIYDVRIYLKAPIDVKGTPSSPSGIKSKQVLETPVDQQSTSTGRAWVTWLREGVARMGTPKSQSLR